MKIAVVGATGAVGEEFIKILNQDNEYFKKLTKINLYASKKSVGKQYNIQGIDYSVSELNNNIFKDIDVAFFFVSSILSREYSKYALENNCIIIDNSSAFRMSHPLIVPEINQKNITGNIIANPNCSSIMLCMVLYPLYQISKIKKLVVSTYQAVSGAGYQGIEELNSQIRKYSYGEKIFPSYFPSQCVNNVFSHNTPIDLDTGNNEEEEKIINETKKILDDQDIDISATCIRIPVFRAHCESVNITFEDEINLDLITNTLNRFPGVKILDNKEDNKFPEPIIASNKDDIIVGRIRVNPNDKKNINLFLSGDQLRKGAALNAIQIAKTFM